MFTEEELAGLSDAERAALEADQEEVAALEAVAGDDEADGQDEGIVDIPADKDAGAADEHAGEAEASEEVAAGSNDKSASEVTDDVSEKDGGNKPFVPRYQAEAVEDFDGKVAALSERLEKDEISLADYNKELSRLITAKTKAELAIEQAEQTAEQRWQWEVETFLDNHEEYKSDEILMNVLDATVKTLAAKQENEAKSGSWFLKEAHRLVSDRFATKAAGPATKGDPAPETRTTPRGKPDLKAVPKTLAHVPAADISETGANAEFAHLDNLDGIDLERALAKMSPEQQDRYLRAAG